MILKRLGGLLSSRIIPKSSRFLSLLQPVILAKDKDEGKAVESFVRRVYPEKFEEENRRYISVWEGKKRKQTYNA